MTAIRSDVEGHQLVLVDDSMFEGHQQKNCGSGQKGPTKAVICASAAL
ncbi:MAG: hypothetical protein ACYDEF_13720 [Methanosarcina sp.]